MSKKKLALLAAIRKDPDATYKELMAASGYNNTGTICHILDQFEERLDIVIHRRPWGLKPHQGSHIYKRLERPETIEKKIKGGKTAARIASRGRQHNLELEPIPGSNAEMSLQERIEQVVRMALARETRPGVFDVIRDEHRVVLSRWSIRATKLS
jgi:hypothetical protein